MMKIRRLSPHQKRDAVAVLAVAFHDYPVMRFVLRAAGDEYEKQLEALIGFFCDLRFVRNWPVLGVRENESWAAIALVNEPVQKTEPPLTKELKSLRGKIGAAAWERLMSYEKQSSAGEPEAPHHFLGMIGVRPEFQGKGYAGTILKAVIKMAESDPISTGVCLSTEDPDNILLYERFGFRTIAEVEIDGLHSWCMFLRV